MNLNILNAVLADPDVNEAMWNGFDKAFVELNGVVRSIPSVFRSQGEFNQFIQELIRLENSVSNRGLAIDGIMPDGSRFHVTIPPLSPDGPTLTIRKFSDQKRGLTQMISSDFMSAKLATFLEACVKGRINIVISGATGAGKTTLLNTLVSLVSQDERIITIEDIPEIQADHANWVRLLAVHSDNALTTRDCLVGCLRMRPDRIIVGECRSNETLEMLEAMNTGHDGGMTTIHANSTGDALTRLETLILFHAGAEIPLKALRRRISDAVDLVVQVKKDGTGRRYIDEVLEVVGMEGDTITRLPLFARPARKGQNLRLVATGHPPTFMNKLEARGILLPKGFFDAQNFEAV